MNTLYSKKEQSYLFAALGIAIVLHAIGILWLQKLKLEHTAPAGWHAELRIEHPSANDSGEELESIFQRNQQLADAFQQLKELPIQEVAEARDDFSTLSIEFTDLKFQEHLDGTWLTDSEMSSGSDTMGNHDFLNDEANKESHALLAQTHDPSQEIRSTDMKPSSSDWLSPDHRQIALDLAKVTELLPSQPLYTPFEKVSVAAHLSNAHLEAPTLSGCIASQGFGNQTDAYLENGHAPSYYPEGILAQAPSSKQTGNLFLPQTNKKLKPEESVCMLPKPHPTVVRGETTAGNSIHANQFLVSVETSSRKEREGYLFRLHLQPVADAQLPRLHRNIYFIIDRSALVSPQRYELSKAAVSSALRFLNEGDSFNILLLDHQITLLAADNLPWNAQQVEAAVNFLYQQPYSRGQPAGDLYTTLSSIAPQTAGPDEINIAILLTDGDTRLNREHQSKMISKWTQRNAGKVALFSVALPDGDNLGLLEVLSTFNHGKMYISSTAAGMSKTVAGLVQALQPIGKDLIITAVSNSKQTVTLSPPNQRAIPLFAKIPLVLYGATNRNEDFYLFIQGQALGKRLDLKQTVQLTKADSGDALGLEKAWALQNAQVYYERYMKDGNGRNLQLASQLLAPYQLPLAFY